MDLEDLGEKVLFPRKLDRLAVERVVRAKRRRKTLHNDAQPARPDEVKPSDNDSPSTQKLGSSKKHDLVPASSGEDSNGPNIQQPGDNQRNRAPASSGEGNPSKTCDSSRTRQLSDDSTHGDTYLSGSPTTHGHNCLSQVVSFLRPHDLHAARIATPGTSGQHLERVLHSPVAQVVEDSAHSDDEQSCISDNSANYPYQDIAFSDFESCESDSDNTLPVTSTASDIAPPPGNDPLEDTLERLHVTGKDGNLGPTGTSCGLHALDSDSDNLLAYQPGSSTTLGPTPSAQVVSSTGPADTITGNESLSVVVDPTCNNSLHKRGRKSGHFTVLSSSPMVCKEGSRSSDFANVPRGRKLEASTTDLVNIGTMRKRFKGESVPCFRDSTAASLDDNITAVPCFSVSTTDGVVCPATLDNPAIPDTSSDSISLPGEPTVDNARGESAAGKRSSESSVLDLAIISWNGEVDRVTESTHPDTTAEHVEVMGNIDQDDSVTADARLAALRERVLARIVGKQRRLDNG